MAELVNISLTFHEDWPVPLSYFQICFGGTETTWKLIARLTQAVNFGTSQEPRFKFVDLKNYYLVSRGETAVKKLRERLSELEGKNRQPGTDDEDEEADHEP